MHAGLDAVAVAAERIARTAHVSVASPHVARANANILLEALRCYRDVAAEDDALGGAAFRDRCATERERFLATLSRAFRAILCATPVRETRDERRGETIVYVPDAASAAAANAIDASARSLCGR